MRRSVRDTLELAVEHHRAGRLDQAEALYRKVIAIQPNEADALHLLGMLAHQQGHYDESPNGGSAVRSAARPARVRSSPTPWAKRWPHRARREEADCCFKEALALHLGDASAHENLADALSALGRATRSRPAL